MTSKLLMFCNALHNDTFQNCVGRRSRLSPQNLERLTIIKENKRFVEEYKENSTGPLPRVRAENPFKIDVETELNTTIREDLPCVEGSSVFDECLSEDEDPEDSIMSSDDSTDVDSD